MAKIPKDKEETMLTAEEPVIVETGSGEVPEVPAVKVPEIKEAVEVIAKEVTTPGGDSVVLGRAIVFLAFKILEQSEFAEFKMRYPEIF